MFIPIFNVYNGEQYEIAEKDISNILEGEIPLKKKPSTNCKQCYGRAHTGIDLVSNTYTLCRKCVVSNLDTKYMLDINFNTLGIKR
jgi:hypothetical protein